MHNRTLGINGLGRIGKLTLWNQLAKDNFDRFVINLGRGVGTSFDDLVQTITSDSTYGSLEHFLFGRSGKKISITAGGTDTGELTVEGKKIRFLTSSRNPKDIPWKQEQVRLVIDCTGAFLDPSLPEDHPKGSIRGHLAGGAGMLPGYGALSCFQYGYRETGQYFKSAYRCRLGETVDAFPRLPAGSS